MSRFAPGVARLHAIAISLALLNVVFALLYVAFMVLSFVDRPNGLFYAVASTVVLAAVVAASARAVLLQRRAATPTK